MVFSAGDIVLNISNLLITLFHCDLAFTVGRHEFKINCFGICIH